MAASLRLILLILTMAGLTAPAAASLGARGNVTANGFASFAYDDANQPVSYAGNGGNAASYAYDGNFRRVKMVENGETVYSFYSKTGGLIYRHNATDPTKHDDYIRVGGLTVARVSGSGASYAETFLLTDHLGSATGGADASGVVQWRERYRPFGDIKDEPAANINNTGFTGHVLDLRSGLVYMQARYYHPVTGRFYSTDPIGYQDQLNLYAYVANDPVNKTDPTGLASCESGDGPCAPEGNTSSRVGGAAQAGSYAGDRASGDNIGASGRTMTTSRDSSGTLHINFVPNNDPSLGEPMMSTEEAAEIAGMIFPNALGLASAGVSPSVSSGSIFTRIFSGSFRSTRSLSPNSLIRTQGRTMSNRQFANLKADIKANGIREPIKFATSGGRRYVVDGHHRLQAARELGLDRVPAQQVQLPYGGYASADDLIAVGY